MKILFAFLLFVSLVAIPAQAQPLENYLEDKADTTMRVELVAPPELIAQPQTFWGKIRSFLGIRKPQRYQPPVGTTFTVQSSAYAPSPYQTDSTPCITAAGTRVRPGVVATNFLPMGTLLEINGEEFIVEDRMNPRYKGYYIDLWFPSTSSALEFGRKNLTVTVKGYAEPGEPIREAEESEVAEEGGEGEIVDVPSEDESVWTRVAQTFSTIRSLLGARSPQDVDRYDVDCFESSSDEQ